MKADVAIVIVSYNSEDHIGACLDSVFAQRKSVNQQVIVVDNDSRDGTVSLIRERYPEVELVVPGANLGFAKGVNLGVRHANAEFVLLLNPDTVILENAVDVVVDFARKNPGHGLYGGRTLRPDGSLEPSSCWGLPSLWSMTLFAFGLGHTFSYQVNYNIIGDKAACFECVLNNHTQLRSAVDFGAQHVAG